MARTVDVRRLDTPDLEPTLDAKTVDDAEHFVEETLRIARGGGAKTLNDLLLVEDVTSGGKDAEPLAGSATGSDRKELHEKIINMNLERPDGRKRPGVRCLAAPVFAADGIVVAAIGITAAALRFSEARIPETGKKVRSVAQELSVVLGYTGNG